jgi:hypothetical protein
MLFATWSWHTFVSIIIIIIIISFTMEQALC